MSNNLDFDIAPGSYVEYKGQYFEGDDLLDIVVWYVDNKRGCDRVATYLRKIKNIISDENIESNIAIDKISKILGGIE